MAELLSDPGGSSSKGEITDHIRSLLENRGYASGTIDHYVSTVRRFKAWMESRGEGIEDSSPERVLEYLTSKYSDGNGKVRPKRQVSNTKAALNHLLSVLGKFDNDKASKANPTDKRLEAFIEHLKSARGLSPATILYRRRYIAEFLAFLCERQGSDQTAITPQDVTAWMTIRAKGLKASSANLVAGSLRSFLQYRELSGTADWCPPSVVPAAPNWRLGGIPRYLDETQLGMLLRSFDQSPAGRRDFAMALLMSEMGLRASEVAHLTLGDIDWRSATLTVRRLKADRDRVLPLARRPGEAIAAYLRWGRLSTDSRALFVRHSVPRGSPLSVELVRCAMRRAYARAGFSKEWTGTHLLRHTAATRMQRCGASLKEVADVLGHRSIDTTIIYAKVDLPALRAVALPWPGVLQ